MAEAEADQVRTMAGGEAARIKAIAEADAERAARVGIAQAMAVEEQVRAYGGPRFQLTQQVLGRFAEAVEKSGAEVVPRIVIGGGTGADSEGGGAGLLQALLGVLLSERLSGGDAAPATARDPEMERISTSLRRTLKSALDPGAPTKG